MENYTGRYWFNNYDWWKNQTNPEIYWKCISAFGVLPKETLIVEDSPVGLLAANMTNSYVLRVKSSKDITYQILTE